jgi:asparagine synthase (glutamine-hydrolysing)
MCGIAAMLGFSSPIDAEGLIAATRALRHRGPDGHATWLDPGGQVGLGHTRLAVRARERGGQPLFNEDRSVVAVVNGEFYGAEDVRRELESAGHRFRTDSDSELLVHLYEEGEEEALTHLRGEFAFVLWDGRRRRLWAARDRFGVRPLCWAVHRGRLLVASEAKALFAAGYPAAWDEAAWFAASRMQVLPPGRTLFAGVHSLEPGAMLFATPDGARVLRGRYADLDLPEVPDSTTDDAALGEALTDAVRVRLAAEAPLCAVLSGGIDSATVAAIAARDRTLNAYTIDFPGDSEIADARACAAALGLDHRVVETSVDSLIEAFSPAVAHGEGLAINLHISAKYLLSWAMARDGFKVALSGEGADEVFHGYAHLRADHGFPPHEDRLLGMHLPFGPEASTAAVASRLGFVPTWIRAKASLGQRVSRWLVPDFGQHHPDPFAAFVDAFDAPHQLTGRSRADQAMYLWTKSVLSESILRTLGDGMEMAHGVEGRPPLLDGPLFEVARRLPAHDKVDKAALRRIAARWLPVEVAQRPKRPFLAPPLAVVAPERLHTLLDRDALARVPGVDLAAVDRDLALLPSLPEAERRAFDPAWMLLASAAAIGAHYRL